MEKNKNVNVFAFKCPMFSGKLIRRQIRNELNIYFSISSKYLLKLYGAEPHINSYSLSMYNELMTRGDLEQFIHEYSPLYDSNCFRCIASQVIIGIYDLHENRFLHRDIKPGNILLTHIDGYVKLADFGISKLLLPGQNYLQNQVGTLSFFSPEQSHCVSGYAGDIWALGITLFILATRCNINIRNHPELDRIFLIMQQDIILHRPTFFQKTLYNLNDKSIPKNCKELIIDMLSFDLNKRPSALNLLYHPSIYILTYQLLHLNLTPTTLSYCSSCLNIQSLLTKLWYHAYLFTSKLNITIPSLKQFLNSLSLIYFYDISLVELKSFINTCIFLHISIDICLKHIINCIKKQINLLIINLQKNQNIFTNVLYYVYDTMDSILVIKPYPSNDTLDPIVDRSCNSIIKLFLYNIGSNITDIQVQKLRQLLYHLSLIDSVPDVSSSLILPCSCKYITTTTVTMERCIIKEEFLKDEPMTKP